ncbi:MAG: pyridoxal 5'-phosphate synthase glutaminase subunit PdxT [Chloroflexi bacterium]|nr:pyridoxal 5'-phosphate synthase glutaminase subunit PdxT [Chloroflexota bacterium]MCI0580893.1 pyridoxal 5'-phosphate synthase glutaminase subunit PdxT [Chloroflexota bacterium]MCI0649741.1 pyridoxal 5'-phosphate synthase glutaminase subunit PdxT [Chloroflexota bacterium]MCI0725480.1 pyridoxal 5'-phosphate synthase glutaminase subunit PdxT [Chloroflexota bacterium]
MKIGVLALQGAFIEHIKILRELGVEAVEVRLPEDLAGLDGLIIPGGESTTIGKLATLYGLVEPLRAFAEEKPVWGTCAGMIFMARDIGRDQPLLGLMDIQVERNAFGRQVDSFETGLDVPALNNGQARPFPAVFIRAPRLVAADEEAGVQVLARLEDGTAVAARQGHWLVTSFHPELTGDKRFHQYFLELVRSTT